MNSPIQSPKNVGTKRRSSLGWRFGSLGLLIVSASVSVACGNSIYLVRVSAAEEAFEEARELGAEENAPYQFYSAELRLAEAKRQAAQAEYGNAARLSREARGYAVQAIAVTKQPKPAKAKAKKAASASPEAPSTAAAPSVDAARLQNTGKSVSPPGSPVTDSSEPTKPSKGVE